jgi:hypothetical protein
MSLHLQRFIDRVQAAEARGQKDLVLSIGEAKDLHTDLTRLLLDLQKTHESTMLKDTGEEVITVKISGGSFK